MRGWAVLLCLVSRFEEFLWFWPRPLSRPSPSLCQSPWRQSCHSRRTPQQTVDEALLSISPRHQNKANQIIAPPRCSPYYFKYVNYSMYIVMLNTCGNLHKVHSHLSHTSNCQSKFMWLQTEWWVNPYILMGGAYNTPMTGHCWVHVHWPRLPINIHINAILRHTHGF